MNFTIKKISELNNEQIDQAIAILVEGLYNIFSIISKDKNILKELFKNSLVDDMNYACLHNDEVAGFMGLSDSQKRASGNMTVEIFEKAFQKRNNLMYKTMTSAFIKPKVKSDTEVEIEFLATAPHFRGKGVATQLIQYISNNLSYTSCVLDVYSKNPNAIRLYEKLGFKQVNIKSDWMLRLRGIGKTITMRLNFKEI
jgi:ribosomal protein S18 acetylase RimI-like enzyme